MKDFNMKKLIALLITAFWPPPVSPKLQARQRPSAMPHRPRRKPRPTKRKPKLTRQKQKPTQKLKKPRQKPTPRQQKPKQKLTPKLTRRKRRPTKPKPKLMRKLPSNPHPVSRRKGRHDLPLRFFETVALHSLAWAKRISLHHQSEIDSPQSALSDYDYTGKRQYSFTISPRGLLHAKKIFVAQAE